MVQTRAPPAHAGRQASAEARRLLWAPVRRAVGVSFVRAGGRGGGINRRRVVSARTLPGRPRPPAFPIPCTAQWSAGRFTCWSSVLLDLKFLRDKLPTRYEIWVSFNRMMMAHSLAAVSRDCRPVQRQGRAAGRRCARGWGCQRAVARVRPRGQPHQMPLAHCSRALPGHKGHVVCQTRGADAAPAARRSRVCIDRIGRGWRGACT